MLTTACCQFVCSVEIRSACSYFNVEFGAGGRVAVMDSANEKAMQIIVRPNWDVIQADSKHIVKVFFQEYCEWLPTCCPVCLIAEDRLDPQRCVLLPRPLQEIYMQSHFSVYNTSRPAEALTVRVALGFGRLAADRFVVRAKVCERR